MEGKISRFRKTRLFCRSFFFIGNWNDSRRNLLETQKIAAPKKNSTFAIGFLISLLKNYKF